MAASLKAKQKIKTDYNIDRTTYIAFVKMCTRKGFTPHVVVEKLMKKYTETGQI